MWNHGYSHKVGHSVASADVHQTGRLPGVRWLMVGSLRLSRVPAARFCCTAQKYSQVVLTFELYYFMVVSRELSSSHGRFECVAYYEMKQIGQGGVVRRRERIFVEGKRRFVFLLCGTSRNAVGPCSVIRSEKGRGDSRWESTRFHAWVYVALQNTIACESKAGWVRGAIIQTD